MCPFINRHATAADAAEISDVLIRSITELCASDHLNDPDLIAGWVANKSPSEILDWIKQGAQFRLRISGHSIAAVGCFSSDGKIQLLYVAPENRGQGHSSELLACMEAELANAGVLIARLVSSKTAEAYYLSRGWEIDGDRVVCYTTDGQPMRKTLSPTKT